MLALRILSIVFPVFAIIGIGWWYGRLKRPDIQVTNQISMDVLVPALVFAALASKSFDLAHYWPLAAAGAAVILGSGLLAWPVARLAGVEAKTFVPPMMFNNSGNMGIPLIVLAFGEAALPAAIVLFLTEMVLHFSLGPYLLAHRMGLVELMKTPVMIATLLGMAVSFSGQALWPPFYTAIRMLGDASIPMLLFSLGVRLNQVSFRDWRIGALSGLMAPATGLMMVLVIDALVPLSSRERAILLVFGALPPAVLNYLMAEQYGQEPEKVASIVLLGNLASLAVMPVVLAFALT
ncbi:MAG: AEC family transporter [Burkholderiales bacterium]|jgi:predicted permease|nr:AEC family transporter [Burkholderiales bacterium]